MPVWAEHALTVAVAVGIIGAVWWISGRVVRKEMPSDLSVLIKPPLHPMSRSMVLLPHGVQAAVTGPMRPSFGTTPLLPVVRSIPTAATNKMDLIHDTLREQRDAAELHLKLMIQELDVRAQADADLAALLKTQAQLIVDLEEKLTEALNKGLGPMEDLV